jgi:uncharacterized protein (DUF362 family)
MVAFVMHPSGHDELAPLTNEPHPIENKPFALSRRSLLMLGGGVAGLAAVAAAYQAHQQRLFQTLTASPSPMPDHRVKLPATSPKLVVAHGKDPARNVRAVLDRIGGLKQFLSSNDIVLIKPNAAWERVPFHGATTTPEVVAELVRASREAGAREVIVTDCPVDDAERSFERSGILKAARDAGAKVILPSGAPFVDVKIPGRLGTWPVLTPYVTATKIINVPIAKHHTGVRASAGMKNWIGITDKRRQLFHADLDESIVSLAALMRPTLTLVDATRILMRNGPRGGNLDDVRTTNALALSTDPVAIDCWAAELLGAGIDEVKYLKLAAERKLGLMDYRSLAVEVTTG